MAFFCLNSTVDFLLFRTGKAVVIVSVAPAGISLTGCINILKDQFCPLANRYVLVCLTVEQGCVGGD